MAFDPQEFAKSYKRETTGTTSGFDPSAFASRYTGGTTTGRAGTENSQQLYNMAVKYGLQGQADDLLRRQAGESPNKIFSGGFKGHLVKGLQGHPLNTGILIFK